MLRTSVPLKVFGALLSTRTGSSMSFPGRTALRQRPAPARSSSSSLPPSPPPPLLDSSPTAESLPWGIITAGFIGFPIVLWAYKCMMLIIFQRRMIYMGYLPPLARTTKIDPSDRLLRGLNLHEVSIESEKGITLRGIALRRSEPTQEPPRICLVYFQGNLGSPLSRLPLFSHLLLSPKHSPFSSPTSPTVLLAIPPRSFYLSTNSPPSQSSLLKDYLAVLTYTRKTYPDAKIVLYGHSLGGAAACVLLGSLPSERKGGRLLVDALVLENPFPSIPTMITESLYPSRWLPYHYLTGFVLDRWDALDACTKRREGRSQLSETDVLFVSGEKDGLVKPELVRRMFEAASVGSGEGGKEGEGKEEGRRVVEWLSIKERSHDDAWMAKGDWGVGVKGFLERSGVLEVEEGINMKQKG